MLTFADQIDASVLDEGCQEEKYYLVFLSFCHSLKENMLTKYK